MKDNYTKEFANQPITNQPGWTGRDTGRYHINWHGCWHKVEVVSGVSGCFAYLLDSDPRKKNIRHIYMIGEYPNNHIAKARGDQ